MTNTKQFTFNTLRKYSPEGQIIKVKIMTLYDLGAYDWLSEKDFEKKWEY